MIWYPIILAFSPLVYGITVPFAYSPMIEGGLYPGLYPGYPVVKSVAYGNQMVDGTNFYGGNHGFNGYKNDRMAQETLKDNKQIVNQGAQGVAGNHMIVKGNEGNQGFHHDMAGANFNQAGGGFLGGAKKYDVAAKDGYGGFGNVGHHKGHHTSGFHKTYHNVESGKDSKFVDEDHDIGEENYGKEFDNAYNDKEWDGHNEGQRGGVYSEKLYQDSAARGGMKAAGAHGTNWDARNQNGYINNQDSAFRNAQMQANRNQNAGMGQSGMRGGMGGMYYRNPQIW